MNNEGINQQLIILKPYKGEEMVRNYAKRLKQYEDPESTDNNGKSGHFVRRRWLVFTICLCVVLATALIFCFIKYKNLKLKYDKNSQFFKNVNINNKNLSSNYIELQNDVINPWNVSRLPENLKPYYYDLNLRVDIHKMEFYGQCRINVACTKPTRYVLLHSEATLVHKRAPIILDSFNNELNVKRIYTNAYYAYIIIELVDELKQNLNYTVVFGNFQSSILNDLKGLYSSSYTLPNGTIKYLAVSQLQPTEARRVFPCYDEPSFKAIFKISIEHQPEFKALSNMEETSVANLDENWQRTTFDETPLMSTYILAFIVCDFESVTTEGPNGLKIRVWARKDYMKNTKYAIDVIPKIYEYFTDYFNISEVVKKSDHFASPDFSAGAMENWGLVVYRESMLLFDDEKSLLEDEYMILLVIAHEISHSWFGNMATLKWWDNVWLNEAFATTLMYFAMDKLRPDFKVFDSQVVHDVFSVMEKDSLVTSHPVSVFVDDPKQVQQYFDEIAYEKGLSVLRMMRGFIGDENFKKGLRMYVKKYKFSNSDMEELWSVLGDAVNGAFNVSQIMTSWLTQKGFPVINVTKTIDTDKNFIKYDFKQQYFLIHNSGNQTENYKWVVPFTYKFEGSNTSDLTWLNLTDGSIRIPIKSSEDENKWILGNIDFMGYYRVNYEKSNWLKLIHQLKTNHHVFSSSERAALVYDSFTFARVGYIDYSIALDLASYLKHETEYVPWEAFFKSIKYIESMLSTSQCYGQFQNYVVKQVENLYYKLGWNDTGAFTERLLRVNIIKNSAYYGLKDPIEKSKLQFNEYLQGKTLPKHLAEVTLCIGVQESTNEEWEVLFKKSLTASPAEQNVLWQSLACNKNIWVLWKFLKMTLNETIIKRSEIKRIFNHYSLMPLARHVSFQFTLRNWKELLDNCGSDAFLIGNILEAVTVGVNTQYDLSQLKEMLLQGAGVATNAPKVAIDMATTNVLWMNKYEKSICEFLKNQA